MSIVVCVLFDEVTEDHMDDTVPTRRAGGVVRWGDAT